MTSQRMYRDWPTVLSCDWLINLIGQRKSYIIGWKTTDFHIIGLKTTYISPTKHSFQS